MTVPVTVQRLISGFHDLAAWQNTDFSTHEWHCYIESAELLQHAEPADVKRALCLFLQEGEGIVGVENETRLFLLMRVVYDLPSSASVDIRRVFKGWVNWPAPDENGMVNLSWPIDWQQGRPTLIAVYQGADGPGYAAIEEYRYLFEHFSFRKLRPANE